MRVTLDPSAYIFDPTAATVTFAAGSTRPTHQGQILSIVNTSNEIYLYLPVQSGRGGAYNATTSILTLEIGTATMSSTNALQIVVDNDATPATSALQAAGNILLSGISDKLPALDSGRLPVSGTFWQTTQPISGSVSISGTPAVSISGTPSVSVAGAVKTALGVVAETPYTSTTGFPTGVIPINTQLMLLDCSNCSAVSIQAVSVATGGSIVAEWSNNGTTFGSAVSLPIGTTGSTWVTTIAAAGVYTIPRLGKWLQLRQSVASTAGTTSLSVVQLTDSPTVNAIAQLAPSSASIGSIIQSYNASTTFAGATKTSIFSAASTNAAVIKGSPGKVLGFWFTNTTAAHIMVRLYTLAAAPTVGTSATFTRIVVPPNGYATGGLEGGYLHATGIAIAITAGLGDSDNTAVTAGAIIGELFTI